jgi:hypothetical protein
MLKDVTIRNFRCFDELPVRDLRRINLLVGANGTGKTALLEALYLLVGGGPVGAVNIRRMRGLPGEMRLFSDGTGFRDFWSDLFHHFDGKSEIVVSGTGPGIWNRELRVTYHGDQLLLPKSAAMEAFAFQPLRFLYRVDGREHPISLQMTEAGVQLGAVPEPVPGKLIGAGAIHGPSLAEMFSELSKTNKEVPVIESIRGCFPQIEDISVGAEAGTTLLYASVRSIAERKLPVELVSAGILKFLNILLSVAVSAGGVVLVDELENGLYFEQFPTACSALLDFCNRFDVQLFATTHSRELVTAFAGVTGEEDICLLRAKRANGACRIHQFSGAVLRGAVEEEVEFR